MKYVAFDEFIRFTFRFRNSSGLLADVLEPKYTVYTADKSSLYSGSLTKESTGVFSAIDSISSTTFSINEQYHAVATGMLNNETVLADSPVIFKVVSYAEFLPYASVNDFIQYIKQDITEIPDISLLQHCLMSATTFIERYTRRKFYSKRETKEFCLNPGNCIFLQHYPILAVHSIIAYPNVVAAGSGQTISTQKYQVVNKTGKIIFDENILGSVTVDYSWGSLEVPEDIELACLQLGSFFLNKRLREGVTRENILGYAYSMNFPLPPETKLILDNWRVESFNA